MRAIAERSGLAIALLFVTLPAAAHHSQAIYDRENFVTIEGVVTAYEWSNPHVYLYVETQTDSGETAVFPIEGQVTAILRRLGWDSDTFVPGDRVTVVARPSRDPTRMMALLSSATKNGVTYVGTTAALQGRGAELPVADSLEGIWEVPVTPLIRSFSEPFSWSLTPEGEAGLAVYDDRTMNPQLQCTPRVAPWLMIFTGVHEIELADDTVLIRTEYDTVDRTVHMNETSHAGAEVTHQGHSIGRWEGDVLVVDTTHFADNNSGSARGVRSGSRKHLVERFELAPDRASLAYSFELEDPEFLAMPVTGEVRLAYRPDLDLVRIRCDVETAGRFILSE
ncbi:MAG TPA: DUF6152 family protein [Gammaproteobacteria bacterium]